MEESPRFTSDFKTMINIVFWNSLGMFFIEFLTPIIAKQLMNANDTEIGLIVSIQVVGYLISSTIAGPLTDKWSKKKLVMIGSFGRAFGYGMFYIAILSGNLWMLGIGTFSIGFGVGNFWIPMNALLAEKSHKDHRSTAYGRRSSRLALGNMVGAVLGFSIYNTFIHMSVSPLLIYSPILIYAIANVFAGIMFYLQVDEQNQIVYSVSDDVDDLSPNFETLATQQHKSRFKPMNGIVAGVLFILFVLFLSSINGSLARPFMQNYLLKNVNPNPDVVSLAYLPPAVVSMIIAPYLGKIADKVYPALTITISSVCGAILTYIIINSDSLLLISILWTFDNAVIYLAGLSIQNIVSRVSVRHRGKLFASLSGVENIGAIIGPILGGYSSDQIIDKAPFIISIFVELLLIPFYWVAIKLILPHLAEKKTSEIDSNEIDNQNL